jgi:hypothetical protein
VKALFFEAGLKGGLGGGKEIAWDFADPLAQVVVLRAYLATVGDLQRANSLTGMSGPFTARSGHAQIGQLCVADGRLCSRPRYRAYRRILAPCPRTSPSHRT